MPTHRQESDEDDMVWPPDDFTGEWIVEWPNGQVKFRSLYAQGKPEGDQVCYWQNGKIAQEGSCRNGECAGVWSDYWEDGTKFKETEYSSPGNFTVRWLTRDGRVQKIQVYRDGGDEPEIRILIPDD